LRIGWGAGGRGVREKNGSRASAVDATVTASASADDVGDRRPLVDPPEAWVKVNAGRVTFATVEAQLAAVAVKRKPA
jgi:hypothetical protein